MVHMIWLNSMSHGPFSCYFSIIMFEKCKMNKLASDYFYRGFYFLTKISHQRFSVFFFWKKSEKSSSVKSIFSRNQIFGWVIFLGRKKNVSWSFLLIKTFKYLTWKGARELKGRVSLRWATCVPVWKNFVRPRFNSGTHMAQLVEPRPLFLLFLDDNVRNMWNYSRSISDTVSGSFLSRILFSWSKIFDQILKVSFREKFWSPSK